MSLNIAPDTLEFSSNAWMNGSGNYGPSISKESFPNSEAEKTFRYRLNMLLENLSNRKLFTPGTLSMENPYSHKVRMDEFAAFALRCSWTIPAGMQALASAPEESLLPTPPAASAQNTAKPAPVMAKSASDNATAIVPDWRMQIQAEAYERWLRLRASGCNPTVYSICEDLALWCIQKDIKGGKGQNPRAGTIRNTVLGAGHWTPPYHSVEQAKNHFEQIARTAQTQVAQTKK